MSECSYAPHVIIIIIIIAMRTTQEGRMCSYAFIDEWIHSKSHTQGLSADTVTNHRPKSSMLFQSHVKGKLLPLHPQAHIGLYLFDCFSNGCRQPPLLRFHITCLYGHIMTHFFEDYQPKAKD